MDQKHNSKTNHNSSQNNLTIINELSHDIVIFWENPNESKNDMCFGIMHPNDIKYAKTFTDHFWSARDPATDEILEQFMVTGPNEKFRIQKQPKKEALQNIIFKSEEEFLNNYEEINGMKWIAQYPRVMRTFPIWQPLFIGSKHKVSSTAGFWEKIDPNVISRKKIELNLETISQEPKVFMIHNFLNNDEIDYLINQGQKRLKQSTVFGPRNRQTVRNDVRTSKTAWFKFLENGVIENIANRAADLLLIPRNVVKRQCGEAIQLISYKENEQFIAHYDFLKPEDHQYNRSVAFGNNRFATLLIGLSPAEEGGETSFPNSTAKENGIKIKVSKGSAILFYNMLPDGNLDDKSIHSGLPVIKGEKYVANIWIWDRIYK